MIDPFTVEGYRARMTYVVHGVIADDEGRSPHACLVRMDGLGFSRILVEHPTLDAQVRIFVLLAPVDADVVDMRVAINVRTEIQSQTPQC